MMAFIFLNWHQLILTIMTVVSIFIFAQVCASVVMLVPYLRKITAKRELFDSLLVLFAAVCYIIIQIDIALIGSFIETDFYHEFLRKSGEILFGIIMIRHLTNKRCIYCFHLKNLHEKRAPHVKG